MRRPRFLPVRVVAVAVVALGLTPLVVSPAHAADIDAQQAYLKASNSGDHDNFGNSVAVSGDTMVVGAGAEDSAATGINGDQSDTSAAISGAAYVFTRSGGTWSQQAYLKASNTDAGDQFGFSVAISGDTIVVGANGEDSTASGVNGNQADNSGLSPGAAYVFTRSGGTWSQQAYLKASNPGNLDAFGSAVGISGDTITVGAPLERSAATGVGGDQLDNSASQSGAGYVFTRSGGVWSQQAYLKASNTGAGDFFGNALAVSGDTVVVGAEREASSSTGVDGNQADNSASQSGAGYVFTRSGGVWSQQAYLKASNTGAGDSFGRAAAISADTVVVGASGETGDSGAGYVFTRSGGVWSQQAYLKASNAGAGDQFGWSVAVFGDTVVLGAFGEASDATGVDGDPSNDLALNSGAAYVFTRSGSAWSQQHYLKASNTDAGDRFGYSAAISGDTVVVGTEWEASNATGVNGDQSDNSSTLNGAVYVFGPATDSTAPTVTIDQAPGQVDPAQAGPVKFAVHFSEVVTGFADADVSLSGTAGATTATVTDDPAGTTGQDFLVSVTGMTGDGTVVASVPASAAKDASDNASEASTSTDNTVRLDATKPSVTINQASGQKDFANSSPIKFTVKFSEPVTGFSAGDVTLSGSAGPTKKKVTGSGSSYVVEVSGMSTSGSVFAKVVSGAATDAAGNTSKASTSSDNKVTFHKPIAGLGAKTLNQKLNQETVERDHKITATVKGLAPREWYYFYFDSKKFKQGQADKDGKVTVQYEVPVSTSYGKHTIRVNGQTANRTDSDSFKVVR
jgi:hypothetical protein